MLMFLELVHRLLFRDLSIIHHRSAYQPYVIGVGLFFVHMCQWVAIPLLGPPFFKCPPPPGGGGGCGGQQQGGMGNFASYREPLAYGNFL